MALNRHSLAWKVVAANTLLVSFGFLIFVALEFRKDRNLLESSSRHELTQGVASGALLLSGSRAEALVQGTKASNRAQVERALQTVLDENSSISRLYVLVLDPTGEPRMLASRGLAAEAKLSPVVKSKLKYALERETVAETPIYQDSWGRWISAFYPIRDPGGRVVATLGGDLPATDLWLETRKELKSTLLLGFTAALISVILSFFIARTVTQPIKTMAESAALIASGNLHICLNLRRKDEIGELADSFNQMVERLAAASDERDRLNEQLLKKEKLDQEIKLAAQIQQSFLPVSFPWSTRYRANARSVPAEVVGGDFYDFVELSDDRIGIVIGDVAGRGIAAAIYMARVLSDFRTAALRVPGPREALERLNQRLYSRAMRGIFVTMTYLVLDSSSGELKYSSAGHLPALLRRGATGKVEVLNEDAGLPLGISAQPNFTERSLKLESDDQLLLVTDGVVEGLCGGHEVFNFDGLVEIFQNRGLQDDGVVDAIFEEVERQSSAEVQQDDMTVLTLGWKTEPALVASL